MGTSLRQPHRCQLFYVTIPKTSFHSHMQRSCLKLQDQDPAIEKTLSLLRAEWKTYASISMASPKVMLRAIILDALLQNANSDDATKIVLALLLSSAFAPPISW